MLMPLPDLSTLIEMYYFIQYGLPLGILATMAIGTILCAIAYAVGYQSALKYVWTVGIPHSEKEHNQIYKKWYHGIRD